MGHSAAMRMSLLTYLASLSQAFQALWFALFQPWILREQRVGSDEVAARLVRPPQGQQAFGDLLLDESVRLPREPEPLLILHLAGKRFLVPAQRAQGSGNRPGCDACFALLAFLLLPHQA